MRFGLPIGVPKTLSVVVDVSTPLTGPGEEKDTKSRTHIPPISYGSRKAPLVYPTLIRGNLSHGRRALHVVSL